MNTCKDCHVRISRGTAPKRCWPCSRKHKTIPPENRFWNHVKKTKTCWLWMGGKSSKYGTLSNKSGKEGYPILAHRLSYRMHKGKIPKGFYVMHACDNPPCVNPDHLKLGTHKDNQLDCNLKGRRPKGKNHWNVKLTNRKIIKIRSLSGIISHRKIGKLFGINRSHVGSIINKKVWKHI